MTDHIWMDRGACKGRPELFDLDVIGNDTQAVKDAIMACEVCPVLEECREYTDELPVPIELIQAGRLHTQNSRLTNRLNGLCRHNKDLTHQVCVRCEHARLRKQPKFEEAKRLLNKYGGVSGLPARYRHAHNDYQKYLESGLDFMDIPEDIRELERVYQSVRGQQRKRKKESAAA